MADYDLQQRADGWHVVSADSARHLGGPYGDKAEAAARLREVASDPEYEHVVAVRPWWGQLVAIENPAGTVRRWYDADGKETGSTTMLWDYGFLHGVSGSDDEHLDCYIGPDPDAPHVFIVSQLKAPDFTEYDEQKALLGFADAGAAHEAWRAHRNDGDRAFHSIRSMPRAEFLARLRRRSTNGPIKASALPDKVTTMAALYTAKCPKCGKMFYADPPNVRQKWPEHGCPESGNPIAWNLIKEASYSLPPGVERGPYTDTMSASGSATTMAKAYPGDRVRIVGGEHAGKEGTVKSNGRSDEGYWLIDVDGVPTPQTLPGSAVVKMSASGGAVAMALRPGMPVKEKCPTCGEPMQYAGRTARGEMASCANGHYSEIDPNQPAAYSRTGPARALSAGRVVSGTLTRVCGPVAILDTKSGPRAVMARTVVRE